MPSPATKVLQLSLFIAALVFSLLTIVLVKVAIDGIKESEVLVVSAYTLFSGLTALSSWIALGHARWAPAVCVFATAAAASAYLLEDALRSEDAAGYTFALVTAPLLIAVFVAIGVVRDRRRRSAGTPRARVR